MAPTGGTGITKYILGSREGVGTDKTGLVLLLKIVLKLGGPYCWDMRE